MTNLIKKISFISKLFLKIITKLFMLIKIIYKILTIFYFIKLNLLLKTNYKIFFKFLKQNNFKFFRILKIHSKNNLIQILEKYKYK